MTLSAGTRLGPYEIGSPIGAGGMGEVYRARDSKLDRDVAIKVLPESVAADPAALARFEREAKAVASLSHPNILAIHDFGRHEGVSYAVMELLGGETLRERLDEGPIPQKQAVDYALQVARGLSAAHEKGVVHRDLKPENLFIVRGGHLKILDFGLAKRVEVVAPGEETRAPTASQHTEPGTVMGTVGYMSPEQVCGLPVDHRTDIFSFGAILYELLSGKRAFKRATGAETISAILKEEPPELSASGRTISPGLDRIVRHCLEKDRDDRFHSAHDVAFALAEETSSPKVAPLPAGRRSLPIAAIAIIVLIVAGVFALRRSHKSDGPAGSVKRVAVLPFENLGAPEDDYFADGIADEIRGKLTTLPGVEVIARASSITYKKTAKTPNQIARELGVSYLLTATVRWEKTATSSRVQVNPELVDVSGSGAPRSMWQQPFDASLTDVFQVQSDIASRAAASMGVALGAKEERRLEGKPTESLAAYDAFLKGEAHWKARDGGARELYEKAVALDPRFAQAWAQLSRSYSIPFQNSPKAEYAERARVAAEKAKTFGQDLPETYLALGDYETFVVRNPQRALETLDKGLGIAPTNPDLVTQRAFAQASLGHAEAALEGFQLAQRLDPRAATRSRLLGQAYLWLRRYPEAHASFDRGQALDPANPFSIAMKATVFLSEGDLPGARLVRHSAPKDVDQTALVALTAAWYDAVWSLNEEEQELVLRLTPAFFANDKGVWGLELAQACALRGDAVNRDRYAEEARRDYEERLRALPEQTLLRAHHGLALAYLGRKEDAIREGRRAFEITRTKDPVPDLYVEHQLVRIYTLVGEPDKALDELEPILKKPYFLSPGWLKIDPNFDPLRKNPRFQKLVAGGT